MLDYLVDNLRQLDHLRQNNNTTYVSGKAADTLFKVWKNQNNKISERIFKRPHTMSLEDVNTMKNEGLIRDLGDKLEVTSKGSKVIRVMILGDDRSSFEKVWTEISYAEAESNTKARSLKTSRKKNEDHWWSRVMG